MLCFIPSTLDGICVLDICLLTSSGSALFIMFIAFCIASGDI